MLELSLFSILALFMLGGSVAMIINKQPLFSAFGFLVSMLGLAGMFALLDSQFLALAQIMVSVGAIVVVSMLTILTVNAKEKNLPDEPYKYRWIIFSALLVSPLTLLMYKSMTLLHEQFNGIDVVDTKAMGSLLFSQWVLPFEIVSVLLLSAMVGAIVIARKKRTKVQER